MMLITLIDMSFILFLIYSRPFTRKIDLFSNILSEIMLFTYIVIFFHFNNLAKNIFFL